MVEFVVPPSTSQKKTPRSTLSAISSRILRFGALVLGASTITALLSIATVLINARALGPLLFGQLAVIQAFVAFLGALTTFESWQPIVRTGGSIRTPVQKQRFGTMVSCGLLLDTGAAALAGMLAVLVTLFAGHIVGLAPGVEHYAAFYSLTLFTGVSGTPKGVLRSLGRFGLLSTIQVFSSLVLLILCALLAAVAAPLSSYLITLALTLSLSQIALLFVTLRTLNARRIMLVSPPRLFRTMVALRRFSKMALGSSALSTLINTRRHIEVLIVSSLAGATAAGFYSAASKIVNIVPRFAEPIRQVLFPEIASLVANQQFGILRRLVRSATWVGLLLSLPAIVCSLLLAEHVVAIAYGPAYQPTTLILILLLVGAILTAAGVHLNPAIQCLAGTRPLIRAAAVTLVTFATIAGALTLWIGAPGTAVAALVADLSFLLMMIFVSIRLLRRRSRTDEMSTG